MGRKARMHKVRAEANSLAKDIKPPKMRKYSGLKWWEIVPAMVFPALFKAKRSEYARGMEKLHAECKKIAVKKAVHVMARG